MSAILFFGSPGKIDLTVNPLSASVLTTGTRTGTTNSVTVTPINGLGPYTYSWTLVDGDTMSPTNPVSATTQFTGFVGIGEVLFSTFQCTVTDSIGSSGTVQVTATIIDGSFLGSLF